jgi:hypothetical protein
MRGNLHNATSTSPHLNAHTHPRSIMIVGIGTDLLHIPRIKALIAKRGAPTLARRILSPRELTEFKALIRGKLDKAEAEQAEKNANKDNVERTSFRTVLKGLNRNIENDAVTRFLASR